nr:MAG TPA: hypothetical protein [Caudoviricetes sp.]
MFSSFSKSLFSSIFTSRLSPVGIFPVVLLSLLP